jgi:hypothetical protein
MQSECLESRRTLTGGLRFIWWVWGVDGRMAAITQRTTESFQGGKRKREHSVQVSFLAWTEYAKLATRDEDAKNDARCSGYKRRGQRFAIFIIALQNAGDAGKHTVLWVVGRHRGLNESTMDKNWQGSPDRLLRIALLFVGPRREEGRAVCWGVGRGSDLQQQYCKAAIVDSDCWNRRVNSSYICCFSIKTLLQVFEQLLILWL